MKLHLPLSLRKSLLILLLGSLSNTVYASVLHQDASLITYADFGQNAGRFQVGVTNALLQHLNNGGIVLTYTGGQEDRTISLPMIDFSSAYSRAQAAAISYNCTATVKHNVAISSNFTSQYAGIGSEHALKYQAIEISGNATFSTVVDPSSPSSAGSLYQTDHKVTRLSKLITDVSPAELYDTVNKGLDGLIYFHAGSGRLYQANHSNAGSELAGSGSYVTGGITSGWKQGSTILGTSITIAHQVDYSAAGINDNYPLPWISQKGDSGAPQYVWDEDDGCYKYIGSNYGGDSGTRYTVIASNTTFDQQVVDSYNEHVDMSSHSLVYLNAINNEGNTLSDGDYNTTIHYGEVTDAQGNVLTNAAGQKIQYNGLASGVNTWADLSELKDTQNWYAYDQSYVQAPIADLFPTENLVFTSDQEENNIILKADIDLGAGYTEFRSANGEQTSYTISGESGANYLLNSAGILAGAHTEVHLQLTNPADYMREWRKSGAGNLYIEGSGNNSVLLNLGGSGTTFLNRQNGYAAYNVLANNGSTVVLQGGVGQIARDFTFGFGGATLDMNGNDMEWQSSTDGENRFTIHALTEDALIANYSGASTLRYTEGGSTSWLGSFADSANSSLKIVYEGGGTWTLNSIRTLLQHADSGLLVSQGSVILCGSNTIHALGSDLSATDGRYFHEDDWHYADAAMNVAVDQGANFTLGSHARLIGSITVADGGTYTMQEGVRHQMEYIEGFERLEDTYAIRDYYGHKGDTILNGGTLAVQFSEGTTANTTYEGNISGTGGMTADTARGSLTLSGTNTFSGSKTITNGTLILDDVAAAGDLTRHLWQVNAGGAIAVLQANGNTALSLVDADSEGVLLLTQAQESTVDFSGHSGISAMGALAGKTVEYGRAEDTLNIHNLTGEGTLIVQSTLSGNTRLNIDGRGYNGGTVVLNNISGYTGAISVGSTGGSMALSVAKGQELSGLTVNILSGGTLQAIGEQQSLAGYLNFTEGSTLKGNDVTLTQGAQISGTVAADADTLQTASGVKLNITTGSTLTARNLVAEGDIELNGMLNYEQLTVQNGATLQLRTGGRLDAENAATIAEGGIMRLNLQTLQDKVELKNGGTMFGNGGTIGTAASVLATEGTGTLSAGTGNLTVNGQIGAAEGATLVLAGSTVTINTINPDDRLNGYINSSGGVMDIQCSTLNLSHNRDTGIQTIAGVTLHIGGTVRISSDNTTINASPNNYTAHPFYDFNCIEIVSGKTLTINENNGNGWSNHWNIRQLIGEGSIHWKADTWYVSQTRNSHMLLSGENSFHGTLLVDNNNTEGMIQTLELAHNKASTYMEVQLDGNNASNLSGLAINTANAEVAGIQGNAHSAIYTGAAQNSGYAVTAAGLYSLTLTGDGSYTHAGSIAGDASNGLNITMNGSGSQTFSGSSIVVHDVAALKGSLLFTSNPTLHGDLSIAQGASLQLGDSISLNEGQKLSILAGDSGSPAVLKSALVLNGGQLSFDASGMNTDTATLSLETGISFAEGVNTHSIEFTNASTLDISKVYQLSNGDWSGQTVTANMPEYLNATLTASDTGLSLALGMNTGYAVWDGSAVDAQQNTTYVFINSQGSHDIELTENVSIGNLLLPDNTDYNISGSELTAQNLNISNAKLHIRNTTTASSYSAGEGEIIIEESGTLKLSGTRSGKVELQDLSGTGTLKVNLTAAYSNTLAVDADFEGKTYVQSGNFTINGSTYGNTLHLNEGVNFQLNNGSSVTLEKDLILDGTTQVHQNNNATLTINGSVTGNGTYERRGGGSLTFNGKVDLTAFTQAVKDVSTTMNGATNLDSLTVSASTLTIAGSTTTGNSIGNISISEVGSSVTIGGNNSQQLQGDINISSGGKLTFSGSGADVLDYNAGKNIVVDGGTIDFGTTRQTIQGWNITLKNGATLSGAGASYSGTVYTAAMDFNQNATINVESGENTISANMRLRYGNSRTLTFNVAEGASVNVSGRMHADNTSALGILHKTGTGNMTISSQVALGTIQAQDGTLTLSYTDGQNEVGTLDTSLSKSCKGTFKLAENVALKVTGSILGCSNSAIALAEGASLTSTQSGVIFSAREGAKEARLVCNDGDGEYSVNDSNFELTDGHLKYDSSNNATLSNKLTNSSVENTKKMKLTVDNSGNTLSGVHATAGEIAVLNLSSVDLQNLEAAAGLTVSFYTGSTETASAEADVTVRGTAGFGANAHLNANLTMAAGATLQVAEGGLTMGSDVTLTAGGLLGEELLGRVQTMSLGDSTTLFTSVDHLILNDGTQSYTYQPGELSTKDNMLASIYFTNLTSNNYVLTFSCSAGGDGMLAITMVPEPAGTTLSLLALAAIAARRRRA